MASGSFEGHSVERIAQYKLDEDYPSKLISLVTADSVTDLPSLIQPGNTHFVLFLAVNGAEVDSGLIHSAAEKLLDKGMIYACVWGAECERVHDIIDQARFKHHPDETDDNVIITTWHAEEPLSEAVWFFLNCAWPASAYEHTCSDWVAAVIGNRAWEAEVRTKLVAEKEESESS